jgi:transposase-like protein
MLEKQIENKQLYRKVVCPKCISGDVRRESTFINRGNVEFEYKYVCNKCNHWV